MSIFKRRVAATEFGAAVIYLAKDAIANDALGAIGRCFPSFNASNGWPSFFEGEGYTETELIPYLRMAYHCSIQAMAMQFEASTRREITVGAMSAFRDAVDGYDIASTLNTLEGLYAGHLVYDLGISPASPAYEIEWLPREHRNIYRHNAAFLFAEYVRPRLRHSEFVAQQYASFQSAMGACVGVAERARLYAAKKLKF